VITCVPKLMPLFHQIEPKYQNSYHQRSSNLTFFTETFTINLNLPIRQKCREDAYLAVARWFEYQYAPGGPVESTGEGD